MLDDSLFQRFQIFGRGHAGDFLKYAVESAWCIEPAVKGYVNHAAAGAPQLFQCFSHPDGVQIGHIIDPGNRLKGFRAVKSIIAKQLCGLGQRGCPGRSAGRM